MSLRIAETDDIETCFALRRSVFIEEQGVSEADEYDGFDKQGIHLLATLNGLPIGTARLLIYDDTGKIGRICVGQAHRGDGVGAALVQAAMLRLGQEPGVKRAVLGAQQYAIGFYEKLGFTLCGPVYEDAGIPHRDMERAL